jgi:hypothetical protein
MRTISTDMIEDPFAPTEMNVEGSLFSAEVMEQLKAAWMVGLWFWACDDQLLIYRYTCEDERWKS